MFWKDFLYICWSWLPALAHGKIEENTVNSGIFNGWGDKGIGSIVEHDVFDRFYGDKSVKYRALKETIAKTWKHIQRTRDLGDLESLQGREKWKFHSLGSCHGGEKWKFPSLGSPHGGEKWKFQLGEPPREGKVKIP